jgi:hypothetical protein
MQCVQLVLVACVCVWKENLGWRGEEGSEGSADRGGTSSVPPKVKYAS